MKLIVITPEITIENEPEIANGLFRSGLQRLHIRKPSFDIAAYRAFIEAIDPEYHSRIVIHGSFSLYTELQLGGIHLNSAARADNAVWEEIQGIAPGAISTSFHSWKEIIENDFPHGYVFISPMFDSISKIGYKGSISPDGINEVRKKFAANNKHCPQIIGLGGVRKGTITILQKNGFDGAALLGAVWNDADPVAAFNEIAAAIS